MALISSQTISEDGITPTLTTIETAANTFTNTGNEIIFIKNAGESNTVTVTATISEVDIPQYGELTKNNASFVVGSGASSFIGPFPLGSYAGTDNVVTFTFSSAAEIQVAILTLQA